MRARLLLVLPLLVAAWTPAWAPAPRDGGRGEAQEGARYVVLGGSRFWIDGSATTGPYTCEAREVAGAGHLGPGGALDAEVTIPVRAFNCGLAPMNRDFRRALRAEAHPAIRFDLEAAEPLEAERRAGAWVRLRVRGTLRLAGTARPVTLEARGQRQGGGRVRIQGHHALRMSDFGVEPPAHALGLVRARDAITARFDLLAAAR